MITAATSLTDKDPLHDALVAIFKAIAEREAKSVQEVVEEFFAGYMGRGIGGVTTMTAVSYVLIGLCLWGIVMTISITCAVVSMIWSAL